MKSLLSNHVSPPPPLRKFDLSQKRGSEKKISIHRANQSISKTGGRFTILFTSDALTGRACRLNGRRRQ